MAGFMPDHELKAELARAQVEHRKQGRPGEDKKPYNVRVLTEHGGDGGNSTAYLQRRLAREREAQPVNP
jgi:hypothetical protein